MQNSKTVFEHDPLARNVIRTLLSVEGIALLPVLVLSVTRFALVVVLIACLAFLMFLGALAWLYLRYQAYPVVQEKRRVQQQAATLNGQIQSENVKIKSAQRSREQLGQSERDEIARTLQLLQKTYVEEGLASAYIQSAQIPGVGPKLKERLAAHRVFTAANVSSRVLSTVQGFGESKSRAVLAWRDSIYLHYQAAP